MRCFKRGITLVLPWRWSTSLLRCLPPQCLLSGFLRSASSANYGLWPNPVPNMPEAHALQEININRCWKKHSKCVSPRATYIPGAWKTSDQELHKSCWPNVPLMCTRTRTESSFESQPHVWRLSTQAPTLSCGTQTSTVCVTIRTPYKWWAKWHTTAESTHLTCASNSMWWHIIVSCFCTCQHCQT